MPEGKPKYTPEQIAQLEKSRTISDAELLKGGAEYPVDEKGEKENLLVTEKQRENIGVSHELEKSNQIISNLLESNGVKKGDSISVVQEWEGDDGWHSHQVKEGQFHSVSNGDLWLTAHYSAANPSDGITDKVPLARITEIKTQSQKVIRFPDLGEV